MPLVIVKVRPGQFNDEEWASFAHLLREGAAFALNTTPEKDGELSAKDIEIEYREISPRDVNALPLSVMIFAKDFPSRKRNLDQRADLITEGIKTHGVVRSIVDELPEGARGFVEVLLAPISFHML